MVFERFPRLKERRQIAELYLGRTTDVAMGRAMMSNPKILLLMAINGVITYLG